jgi:CRP-like cAMP-binding protein
MSQVTNAFVADAELLQELEVHSTPIALGEDRVLFREGQVATGVYIVRQGSAILTSGSNGETVLTAEAGPGSLLGVPAVIGNKAYSLTAVAMPGAQLSVASCEDFIDLMQSNPHFSFQLLKVLAEEVRFARKVLTHF